MYGWGGRSGCEMGQEGLDDGLLPVDLSPETVYLLPEVRFDGRVDIPFSVRSLSCLGDRMRPFGDSCAHGGRGKLDRGRRGGRKVD